MTYANNDEYDDVRAELLAEARFEKRKRDRFLAHPDPRDPDYPEEYDDPDSEDECDALVWDGKSKLYSDVVEKFFDTPDEAGRYFDEMGVKDREICVCDPVYPWPLDGEYFEDDDECISRNDLPLELIRLIAQFNDQAAQIIMKWRPDYDRTMIV